MRRSIVSLAMLAACGAMAACLLRASAADPATAPTAEQVEALVARLGDKDFKVRDEVTKKLIEMGAAVVPILRTKAQERGLDPEVAVRIKAVLEHPEESQPVQVNGVDFQIVAPAACELEDGKPVPLALKITNLADKALQFNLYDTIAIHMKDATGKELTIDEKRLRTAIPKPLFVEKGQSITIDRGAELKLQDKVFRLTGSDGAGGTWRCDGIKAGKYTVSFTCQCTQAAVNDLRKSNTAVGPIADDSLFWIGKVTTKELTVEVTDKPKSATRPAASQPADANIVARLVEQLGDKDVKVRDEATKKLTEMGTAVVPILKAKAQEKGLDPEVSTRIQTVLDKTSPEPGEVTVTDAATGITVSMKRGTEVAASAGGKQLWVMQIALPLAYPQTSLKIEKGLVILDPRGVMIDLKSGKIMGVPK